MTPFETYLVFQIDSIIMLFCVLATITFLACLIALIVTATSLGDLSPMREDSAQATSLRKARNLSVKLMVVPFLCLVTAQLLPSRNTLIAMKVVPLLTSDKAMAKYEKAIDSMDASTAEVYGLFRDWLKAEIMEKQLASGGQARHPAEQPSQGGK